MTPDLFTDIFSDNSLKEVASTAYGQVCAPYHTWAVRTAVYAGMYTLPTRDQLFVKLNETGNLHRLLCSVDDLFKAIESIDIEKPVPNIGCYWLVSLIID